MRSLPSSPCTPSVIMKSLSFSFLLTFAVVFGAVAQPRVIAHRGHWTPTGSAQNSLAALKLSDKIGVFGAEFDVHITSDGVAVINHDATLFGVRIEDTPYSRLKKLRLLNGEPLPTLEKYLRQARRLKNNTRLILEIKPHRSPTNEDRCVNEVLRLIKKYGLEGRTDYISFSIYVCERLVHLSPKAHIAYLGGNITPQDIRNRGLSGIDYSQDVLQKHPEWIEEAHRLGLTVNVWTVNTEEKMHHFIEKNVDFITTNHPEEALRLTRMLNAEKTK